MRGGFYVYGLYWKNGDKVVYADQSVSPNPNLYQKDQVLGKAKVTNVVTGVSIQDPSFDYIVFLEDQNDNKI
jgi:hypothetical protein